MTSHVVLTKYFILFLSTGVHRFIPKTWSRSLSYKLYFVYILLSHNNLYNHIYEVQVVESLLIHFLRMLQKNYINKFDG